MVHVVPFWTPKQILTTKTKLCYSVLVEDHDVTILNILKYYRIKQPISRQRGEASQQSESRFPLEL